MSQTNWVELPSYEVSTSHLKKRIVNYEANWMQDLRLVGEAEDESRIIFSGSGMVVVSFYDESELKEKLNKYAASKLGDGMRITDLRYKIIEEI